MVKYYAVAIGRTPGSISTNWKICESAIKGYPGARYKSFPTENEAKQWLSGFSVLPANVHDQGEEDTNTTLGTEITLAPDTMYIFTDGSCSNQEGGWAAIFVWNQQIIQRWFGYVPVRPCTNNIAELYAIGQVLVNIDTIRQSIPSSSKVIIRPDSDYSINALSVWVHGWRKNGWMTSKNTPVENQDFIEPMSKMYDRVAINGSVSFQWVKAHANNVYNGEADTHAKQGRLKGTPDDNDMILYRVLTTTP